MIVYREIPVLKRTSGVLISATPNGCWIEWPAGSALTFLNREYFDTYRHLPPWRFLDAVATPVTGGLYVERSRCALVYLTHGELQQVASAIRKLRAPAPAFARELTDV